MTTKKISDHVQVTRGGGWGSVLSLGGLLFQALLGGAGLFALGLFTVGPLRILRLILRGLAAVALAITPVVSMIK